MSRYKIVPVVLLCIFLSLSTRARLEITHQGVNHAGHLIDTGATTYVDSCPGAVHRSESNANLSEQGASKALRDAGAVRGSTVAARAEGGRPSVGHGELLTESIAEHERGIHVRPSASASLKASIASVTKRLSRPDTPATAASDPDSETIFSPDTDPGTGSPRRLDFGGSPSVTIHSNNQVDEDPLLAGDLS